MPWNELVTELGGGLAATVIVALAFMCWFLLKHVFKLQDLRIEDSKERIEDLKQHSAQLTEVTGAIREATSAIRGGRNV